MISKGVRRYKIEYDAFIVAYDRFIYDIGKIPDNFIFAVFAHHAPPSIKKAYL